MKTCSQEARIAQLEQVVFGLQQELSRLVFTFICPLFFLFFIPCHASFFPRAEHTQSVSSSSGEGDSSKYGHKIKKLKKKVFSNFFSPLCCTIRF